MGYSVSWLAVKGVEADEVHASLNVRATGEMTDSFESPLAGASLGGWYGVFGNGCDHRIVAPPVLALVSRKHEVVACSIEEHVMVSSAAYWREGSRHWSIEHDASRGLRDLQVVGQPPPSLAAHRSKRFAELERAGSDDSDVDFAFEVPLDLAQELTGFRHDEDREPLERLHDLNKRHWWQFWSRGR